VTSIEPLGEATLLVAFGDAPSIADARRARALAAAVRALRQDDPRLSTPVTGVASVLVPFDPVAIDADEVRSMLVDALGAIPETPDPDPTARDIAVEVRYGGDDGPDLGAIAHSAGISEADVIARHAAPTYEVLTLGFAPGFPYLAEVDTTIRMPRLATPRPRVAAGSVAIAGPMTGIYPAAMPGGWRVIGRTTLRLFDPHQEDPATLRPGDRIRFLPTR
jgi:KipI family sensor histidine kinase inhibitor